MTVKVYRVTFREAASADIMDIYRWVYEASLDPVTAECQSARNTAQVTASNIDQFTGWFSCAV